jgi:ParB family transcriptional regulator, chromosome partitioning protein
MDIDIGTADSIANCRFKTGRQIDNWQSKIGNLMTTTIDKRKALGRGLDSLLPGGPRVVTPGAAPATAPAGPISHPVAGTSAIAPQLHSQREGDVIEIALDRIEHNPYQTRGIFREEELRELADSIRASGVIQPIVVRPGKDGHFILILGERRCRASKLAGKTTVPALVRQVSEQHAAEMTIIENLQRADLNCLEQARAFSRLSQEFKLTQEQIGQRTGCSRESVANHLRLLKLPSDVQQLLLEGQLDFSMARVLLTLHNPEVIPQIAAMAVRDNLSVKQLEAVVQDLNLPPQEKPQAPARVIDPNVRAAQQELERVLGVKVEIKDRSGKGKIILQYANLDDFDRVLEMLSGK